MTQHSNRHLTTEQLSALLDEQLSNEERAACEIHLRSCLPCRSALESLRQTVALLHALPMPDLPRPFILPTNLTYLRERALSPARGETPALTAPAMAQQRRPTPLKRPLRILSTLVAVIGLFFLLSSLATMLPRSTLGSASPSSTSAGAPASEPEQMGHLSATQVRKAPAATNSGTPNTTPTVSPIPTPTPTASNTKHATGQSSLPPPSLPLPDLRTSLGQLEVGFTLLTLGILGLLFTRRRRAV